MCAREKKKVSEEEKKTKELNDPVGPQSIYCETPISHLPSPTHLHLNIQYADAIPRCHVMHRVAARAVAIAAVLRVLDEPVRLNHLRERLLIRKVVLAPVLLAVSRGAGGV